MAEYGERSRKSSAEVFAGPSIDRARAGLEPSWKMVESFCRSSRKSADRPHPVVLESFGGVTIYVGAEGFAWWLFQWDAARVAAGVHDELPPLLPEVERGQVSRWPWR